ncbi:RNA-binding cell elongation regulator Jag/EloR [Clostridium thermobutyricum]|uniref:RNA-binding protein KhpB n=1 Tax=Clostridium thermobutyricum DSM 4928 TaxID=1121339 RepID=A0A1V4SLL0_9CLOT|nr:RNA-binding cell elongation regulator Jag/EloR [Clostridium thermobutyricum]OPX44740.1 R3H domain protein [Clostridium thermobutyricum DSM 4928]
MKFIETTGKTVDEALEKALNELNVSKERVIIDVIDEGSKGFLSIIGSKPAKIKVTLKYDYIREAKIFTQNLLKHMNVEGTVDISEENDTVKIDVSGPKMGTIIGYRGETLDSIQYLISLVVNKDHEISYKKVILDTENYRAKREETLKRVALKTARKVIKTGKPFKLEPMNPYERRIIHAALQNESKISTYSEGEDPYRKVVVALK